MKNLYLLLLLIYLSSSVAAQQSDGPKSGSSYTIFGIPGSNKTWNNVSNVASSDNVYSDFGNITGGVGSYTDYLVVTDFGFTVPAGAIITGIVAQVERSDPNGRTSDYRVRIVKTGSDGSVIGSAERSTGSAYLASDSYQQYGGTTDLWGESWTSGSINSPGFGIAIAAQRNTSGGTTGGRIDNIQLTVYYTFSTTLPVHLMSFSAARDNKNVIVKWKTAEETNMSDYVVERSLDGRTYQPIYTAQSLNNAFETDYAFTDYKPVTGTSYYRLKLNGTAGDMRHSAVVSVIINDKESIQLYPSLLSAGDMLNFNNQRNEKITIRFYDGNGKELGRASSKSDQVSSAMLQGQRGMVFYHVFKQNDEIAGRGRIMIQ